MNSGLIMSVYFVYAIEIPVVSGVLMMKCLLDDENSPSVKSRCDFQFLVRSREMTYESETISIRFILQSLPFLFPSRDGITLSHTTVRNSM